ncbi:MULTISPECIES: hypothetical protein [unclassified Bradyrhizobium]|uniref:hypothetical protein n=1 Tax=unclassified Bradyrhizobium TaxID=2631580 RepID=UPI0028E3D3F7|nr:MULTISPECIES: hypothetical protein [unclassified Bradyrhizobium]
MRFIDQQYIPAKLPNDWEARAAVALAEVADAAPEDRSATISKHGDLWRELAPILASLSHRKCWYCEGRENRSDKAVDHFRPKAKPVEADAQHPGYWWQAFAWRNYRYSCTFCNSRRVDPVEGTGGGKHNHFPLFDEGARAFDDAGIPGEAPILLDPTRRTDTTLLYYSDEGRAQPRAQKDQYPVHWTRADVSIRLFHLNHKDSVEERLDLFNRIKKLVDTGRVCFDDWKAGNAAAEAGYDLVVGELQSLMQERAEFSAAARDMVLGFRDDKHPWIDGIL